MLKAQVINLNNYKEAFEKPEKKPKEKKEKVPMKEKFNKEKIAYESNGRTLLSGFKANRTKTIERIKKAVSNPDTFEKMFREYVYENGGKNAAERNVNSFVHGSNLVKNMSKYQTLTSDYVVYCIVLYMIDNSYVISRELMIDQLLERINKAAEDFGYEIPYPMEDESGREMKDPEKFVVNPILLDEDDYKEESKNFAPEQIEKLDRFTEAVKREQIEHPKPTLNIAEEEDFDIEDIRKEIERRKEWKGKRDPKTGDPIIPGIDEPLPFEEKGDVVADVKAIITDAEPKEGKKGLEKNQKSNKNVKKDEGKEEISKAINEATEKHNKKKINSEKSEKSDPPASSAVDLKEVIDDPLSDLLIEAGAGASTQKEWVKRTSDKSANTEPAESK